MRRGRLLRSVALLRYVLTRLRETPVHVDEFYSQKDGLFLPRPSPSVSNSLTVRLAMDDVDKKYADGFSSWIPAETSENSQVIVLYPLLFEKSKGRYLPKGCLLSEVRLPEYDSVGDLLENLTATMVHELLHWAVGGQAQSTILYRYGH